MPKEKDTLVSIEELIEIAMGPETKNTVNFKILQTLLHILARQMRMLQTKVEIRIGSAEDLTDESDSSLEYGDGKSSKAGKRKETDAKGKGAKKSDREKDEGAKASAKGAKSKSKAEKAAAKEKEKEKLAKMSPKEREKYIKEKGLDLQEEEDEENDEVGSITASKRGSKGSPDKGKAGKRGRKSGISVSDAERDNEKYLVVERGAASRTGSRTRIGGIEVVTKSDFDVLQTVVNDLRQQAGPPPMPSLPDNKKLMSDLAKGNASLTDIMQAMQVTARVQAAEEAISRMAGLLTQLASSGAMSPEVLAQLEDVQSELEAMQALAMKGKHKSVGIDADLPAKTQKSEPGTHSGAGTSTTSLVSSSAINAVTHQELEDATQSLKADLLKSIQIMTHKGTAAAEMSCGITRGIADRLDIAINLNNRISTLFALTSDYAEQLSGFDSGIGTQMLSFQEQMYQIRSELKEGLKQLASVNTNAESAAVMELTERFEGLTSDLDGTALAHQRLAMFQEQLSEELKSMVEAIEMMREEKADRDEVIDGLRDKADNVRLSGLMTEKEFADARRDLDHRLELCYDKFRRQDQVWTGALGDLSSVSQNKAELMRLIALKDEVQKALRRLQDKLTILAIQLGEPKAAILMRLLSRDGFCAVCKTEALMRPSESCHRQPVALPALHPSPGEPCVPEQRPRLDNLKGHVCNRWAGGSHTLLDRSVPRERAQPPPPSSARVRQYVGVGADGRLYNMEEDLMPCAECFKDDLSETNDPYIPKAYRVGAGDRAITTVNDVECKGCLCKPPVKS